MTLPPTATRSGIGDMYSKDPLKLTVALSRYSMVPAQGC